MLTSFLIASVIPFLSLGHAESPDTDGPNHPEKFPNEPFGVETTIGPKFVEQFNPLVLDVMKQLVENMELPLPDQVYNIPKIGKVQVHFDHVTCHDLKIEDPSDAKGMYLAESIVGFALNFDVECRSLFSTNIKLIQPGWANLTLRGAKANSELQFEFDDQEHVLNPILKKLDLGFQSVDIKVDNNPIANFVTKTFKSLLPPITSAVFKRAIRMMLPGIVQSVMDIHFSVPDGQGNSRSFHTEFLGKPTVHADGMKVKLTLVGGEGKSFGEIKDETVDGKPSSVNKKEEQEDAPKKDEDDDDYFFEGDYFNDASKGSDSVKPKAEDKKEVEEKEPMDEETEEEFVDPEDEVATETPFAQKKETEETATQTEDATFPIKMETEDDQQFTQSKVAPQEEITTDDGSDDQELQDFGKARHDPITVSTKDEVKDTNQLSHRTFIASAPRNRF